MSRGVLIQKQVDIAMLGGLSLACSAGLWLLGRFGLGAGFSPARYLLAILVLFSYPHFIASMKVFYSRPGVLREHPFIALWLPLGMAGFFGWVIYAVSFTALVAAAQLALVLLYWHFTKQAYGVSLWLGGGAGLAGPMARLKKNLLLATCLLFGAYGFMGSQGRSGLNSVFKIGIPSFHVQPWAISFFGALAYVSLAAFAAWSARDFFVKRSRTDFGLAGWIPLLAVITWFDPHIAMTAWGAPVILLAPVFHALQYMPFPIRSEMNLRRTKLPLRLALYFVSLVVVGAALFELLPNAGAHLLPGYKRDCLVGGVAILLNVHHYFIDSVIWRFRDPKVLRRLVPLTEASTPARQDQLSPVRL